MTVSDPTAQPDPGHPIHPIDVPDTDERAKPAPTPEHHPPDGLLPGEDPGPEGPAQ